MRRLLAVALLVGGCGDNFSKGTFEPQDAAHHTPDSPTIDGPAADAGPRGPNAFVIPSPSTGTAGAPYGLYWDDSAKALFITDDTSGANRIIKWTDANGFQTFASITGSNTLGGIIRLSDNTMYTPNLGNGTSGKILTISSDGQTVGALTGASTTYRRIGLALDPTGNLFEAYFLPGTTSGTQIGSVASLTVVSGAVTAETTITTSVALKKVVGILAGATTLKVCDQTAKKIYDVAIADGTTTTFATPPSCDLMIQLANGDIVTGGLTGGLYRISPAGAITSIASGMDQVRGVAYDPTLKRVFAVEFRTQMTTMPLLHVIPLD